MPNLQQTIFDTKEFHRKCLELSHGVLKRNSVWMHFWPTHFIFAFIAFNNIYNINWQKSFRRGQVYEWAFPNGSKKITESDKMNGLINFCSSALGINIAYNYYQEKLQISIEDVVRPGTELENVFVDSRTRNSYPEFMRVFNEVYYDAQVIDEVKPDYIKKLILFVYKVRCCFR